MKLFGNDFDFATFFAFLFPCFLLQSTFDQDGRTLAEVFGSDLCEPSPQRHVEEIGFVHPLVISLDTLVDCQANIRYRCALGGVAQLYIASQIADKDNAVKTGHNELLFKISERLSQKNVSGVVGVCGLGR